ncbi:dTDP-4-dehydrorhamnose 3,5-epimerase family protein [Patescibacteria group bacterium]|nr:dTDP-4-dehydrorhamnose 3,5-epimerase family protein [Patescibacteria group bacterium]MBU1663042.1 dTDP-4-dehydrorhamnose 3,5-epimerase family protein [Patescibacteria group bacterium]MBU1934118.1 dTDP-4-dehydrorhamnose 3,5-epimerase family protein [Patescibacteria group bacterium]MBU2007913.1 dTDP-4-dehydrorhamnose 3,5-epimerase family protein [Patescibacteria group bacterium]MBU2233523.1 dTDP-4-dehydrorhamnose 3,5-epimerase family protein [Patescibacteria group bacterium]
MITGVIIKKIAKHEDGRGWLAEFYRQDEMKYQPVMAYASITKPGVARGPHEHKFQADGFVFIGPGNFELHLWDRRKNSRTDGEHMEIQAGENNPILVIVPPGVVHGYKCVGDKDGLCINMPDKLYKGEGKKEEVDEIRWENQENGKYKIE